MERKPKLITVVGEELADLLELRGDISAPKVFWYGNGYYCDAEDLRSWRATHTSGATDASR